MKLFLYSALPKQIAKNVHQYCLTSKTPNQHARQFCAHYAENPSATDHFTLEELIQAPELWFVSHEEGQRRNTWVKEVYPRHIERTIDITDSVLQCGKCKQNTVDYYEKQTRGADEPMTLFANCLSCGNRWRQ
jgi:DNA-directed RNA polymerase subunit M/transcription elongation factor TFIIS|tara:strand:- start:367 stop:765 length:399 start_codon:yes stop_codon:yes gene_type:complete